MTQVIETTDSLEICGAIASSRSKYLGNDVGTLAGCNAVGVAVTSEPSDALRGAKVAIDFSVPNATIALLNHCVQQNVGLVIGTTGLESNETTKLENVAAKIPVLYAPNMSMGVVVSYNMLDVAARALGADVDVEIFESHHKHKIDSPSGTAVRMGEVIASARGTKLEDVAVYGRQGVTGERPSGVIGFHSARGGDVVGEHTVTFFGKGERIEVTHRATSRANFAAGAARAVSFIAEKVDNNENGLFGMNQVLGLT